MAELIASAPDVNVLERRSEWSLREVTAHIITGAPMFADMANGIPGTRSPFRPACRTPSSASWSGSSYEGLAK
jgi:hypothetical protein